MSLVRCRECAQEVASTAPICPRCGVRRPGRPPSQRVRFSPILKIACVLVGIVAFGNAIGGVVGLASLGDERQRLRQADSALDEVRSDIHGCGDLESAFTREYPENGPACELFWVRADADDALFTAKSIASDDLRNGVLLAAGTGGVFVVTRRRQKA